MIGKFLKKLIESEYFSEYFIPVVGFVFLLLLCVFIIFLVGIPIMKFGDIWWELFAKKVAEPS